MEHMSIAQSVVDVSVNYNPLYGNLRMPVAVYASSDGKGTLEGFVWEGTNETEHKLGVVCTINYLDHDRGTIGGDMVWISMIGSPFEVLLRLNSLEFDVEPSVIRGETNANIYVSVFYPVAREPFFGLYNASHVGLVRIEIAKESTQDTPVFSGFLVYHIVTSILSASLIAVTLFMCVFNQKILKQMTHELGTSEEKTRILPS